MPSKRQSLKRASERAAKKWSRHDSDEPMDTGGRRTVDGRVATQKAARPGETRVLVIYTGGTIGMRRNERGVYAPEPHYLPNAIRDLPPLNDKEYVAMHYADARVKPYALPPVTGMRKRIVYWLDEYKPLLDSSDMTFKEWILIAKDIRNAYEAYDGFVVLHGTDTLPYTACALSFMMENLGKPVIPLEEARSDGHANLVGALVTAGYLDIPEVSVYFNNKLFRGNRVQKLDNSALDAFASPNMRPLAHMDIEINVDRESVFRGSEGASFRVQEDLCRSVGILRIFPSMPIEAVRATLAPPTKGVVLQTLGSGNIPSRRDDILREIQTAVDRGCLLLNVSQCLKGYVDANYETGRILLDAGVIPGADMTTEAALSKLAYVLGKDEWDMPAKRKMLQKNLRGELSDASDGNALIGAVKSRNLDVIRAIREAGGQLVVPSIRIGMELCLAACQADMRTLQAWHAAGATLNERDYHGRTALHLAVVHGRVEVVEFLCRNGADPSFQDHGGVSSLDECDWLSGTLEAASAMRGILKNANDALRRRKNASILNE